MNVKLLIVLNILHNYLGLMMKAKAAVSAP